MTWLIYFAGVMTLPVGLYLGLWAMDVYDWFAYRRHDYEKCPMCGIWHRK